MENKHLKAGDQLVSVSFQVTKELIFLWINLTKLTNLNGKLDHDSSPSLQAEAPSEGKPLNNGQEAAHP